MVDGGRWMAIKRFHTAYTGHQMFSVRKVVLFASHFIEIALETLGAHCDPSHSSLANTFEVTDKLLISSPLYLVRGCYHVFDIWTPTFSGL